MPEPDDLDEAMAFDLAESSRRMRGELREAQAGLEAITDQLARKDQDLGDVVLDAMHRGRRVRLRIGSRSLAGFVVHVGQDVAILQDTAGAAVDVRLSAVGELWLDEAVPGKGRARSSNQPATFADCLEGLEATGRQVELGGAALEPVACRVAVVARDHIVVAVRAAGAGRERVVARDEVSFVVRR